MNDLAIERYNRWLEKAEDSLKKELLDIRDIPEEIEKRFYKELSFGTGGIRGVLGAGTAMMNVHVVRRASQGLANYAKKNKKDGPIVICYDTRRMSKEFAIESAKVLKANGFKVYVFDQSRPTPMLSLAVRELQADWGIVITASHNPSQYNGFKVYLSNGVQATPEYTEGISLEINSLDYFDDVILSGEEPSWLKADEMDEIYLKKLNEFLEEFNFGALSLKVLYTPLHGSGLIPVTKALKLIGVDFSVVENQAILDPEFPTVRRPNPEEREAFEEALRYSEKQGVNFDLIIATDPDCDRMGIMYRTSDGFQLLTGNQIGVLMLDYLVNNSEIPSNSFVVKTIVTTDMVKPMCEERNIELVETLTGFKFIGKKIEEKTSNGEHFLFAFEESYGYLSGDFVRDKDGIIASALACLTFDWLKKNQKDPMRRLRELSERYGYFKEKLLNFEFESHGSEEIIQRIMKRFRKTPPQVIGSLRLSEIVDHLNLGNELFGDVVQFAYESKLRVIVRPSGTEPKLKIYLKVRSNIQAEADSILESAERSIREFMMRNS